MSDEFENKLLELVGRLRKYKVSAPPEHPVHPKICDETADFLEKILKALTEFGDAYETDL